MNKTQGKDQIAKLSAYYAKNLTSFASDTVKEAQVRLGLIDPFFEALGWDVNNKNLVAPQYREVVPEESLRVGGTQRAPDYAFRIGTQIKFFAEAKKCTANVSTDASHAYQLRRYGWSGKTPVSVLTNFSEFAAYDCTRKPAQTENASKSRLLYITYDQYADRWDEIWEIYSREAVWSGGFDSFAASKKRRGTTEVDAEFLKEIEQWRERLAKNIALRNIDLTHDDINSTVQLTIDRIIFLRMAEDRGLEPFQQLLAVAEQSDSYKRFVDNICRKADDKYNSGLFHLRNEEGTSEPPDTVSPSIRIDDKVFKPILQGLYLEHGSPYDFGVIPVEILGTVYERFLGKVIRLTAGHQAKIEEKPAVRKAGGVYYTPAYVVNYIVKRVVESAIAGKSPTQLRGDSKSKGPYRVIDMACGSGSFLLGAYRCLLDYCLAWYVGNQPGRYKKAVYQNVRTKDWHLTIEEKKRILTTHIYGIDIDRQAVEVTKLSLLLKALEGESEATLSQQLQLFGERALPNLADNIRCGNSLISHDYFVDGGAAAETIHEINPFDWNSQFPEVSKAGGWDCIIGNPPYVQIEKIPEAHRRYYKETYGSNGSLGKRYDLYQIFILKALNLLRSGGSLGYIVPNTFLMGHSYELLRTRITSEAKITELVDLPQGVFEGVTVDNVLLFFTMEPVEKLRSANSIAVRKLNPRSLKTRLTAEDWDDEFVIKQSVLETIEKRTINVQANPEIKKIIKNIEKNSIQLGELTDSSQGIILYEKEEDSEESEHTGVTQNPGWKRLLRGTNIKRYRVDWGGEYVNYGPWLWCQREERFFNQPKILLQAMRNKSLARRLVGTIDTENYYNAHNLANIIVKSDVSYSIYYLLAIFNSSIANFWYRNNFPNVNINPSDFRRIPIRKIDFKKAAEKSMHDKIAGEAEALLNLNRGLSTAKSEAAGLAVLKQIEAVDLALDQLIYKLYGLSKANVDIVAA